MADMTDLEAVKKAIIPGTRLVHIETPDNPTVGITDIEAIAKIACSQLITPLLPFTSLKYVSGVEYTIFISLSFISFSTSARSFLEGPPP